ncbi:hypothetical protein ACFQE1_02095 [Halobium palmae]|uniref:Uncharacterized protein n=1 Tax=Halobium palmae TaxID=1776492 RepID=A0ABD5RWS1_9EURY
MSLDISKGDIVALSWVLGYATSEATNWVGESIDSWIGVVPSIALLLASFWLILKLAESMNEEKTGDRL